MTEFELYDRMLEAEISPDQYFTLAMIVRGNKKRTVFNIEQAKRQLRTRGFLDKNFVPTEKCLQYGLFQNLKLLLPKEEPEDVEFDTNVRWYIQLFPPIRLPSGRMARENPKLVKAKFRKFFELYQYEWKTIFEATERYVNYYAQKNYQYMRNCIYFILKDSTSDLALECDSIINNKITETQNSFSTDI
jgi:hypothetical protein